MTHTQAQAGLDRLHAAMAARVEQHQMPGMVTLIARGDRVHVEAFGWEFDRKRFPTDA